MVLKFTTEDLSSEDIARLRGIYEPLAESVRSLVDATIRTEADAQTVAEVTRDIDAAVARTSEIMLGMPCVRFDDSSRLRSNGASNAAISAFATSAAGRSCTVARISATTPLVIAALLSAINESWLLPVTG
jgi:hypothetical protein